MRFQQYITESINDKGILKCVMLGGLSASGKSTIMRKILDGNIPIKSVNTDKFTEYFDPKNQNWKKYGKKTKDLTNKELVFHLNSLLPIYLDSVSANIDDFKRRLKIIKNMGYDVSMLFVNTSKRTSIKRSINREKSGGREVIPKHIKDTYDKFFCKGTYDTPDCAPPLGVFTSILGAENITIVNNNDNMVTDKVVNDLYKKMYKYYMQPVKNEKGKKLLDYMKKNGYKYYNEVPKEWKHENKLLTLDNVNLYHK